MKEPNKIKTIGIIAGRNSWVHPLIQERAKGVSPGCTEIPVLLDCAPVPVPFFGSNRGPCQDSREIHPVRMGDKVNRQSAFLTQSKCKPHKFHRYGKGVSLHHETGCPI
jgi:hypothetical protein